mmetsp:Transcript_51196/g.111255  ORF Transcript_51196/g.111255 Transcript_51196/m.111255 type:complete len:267 (+) Transcript_51196:276-1076(+)
MGSSVASVAPTSTKTFWTTALRSARMTFCIFIASTTQSCCPATTMSPAPTAMETSTPGIGESSAPSCGDGGGGNMWLLSSAKRGRRESTLQRVPYMHTSHPRGDRSCTCMTTFLSAPSTVASKRPSGPRPVEMMRIWRENSRDVSVLAPKALTTSPAHITSEDCASVSTRTAVSSSSPPMRTLRVDGPMARTPTVATVRACASAACCSDATAASMSSLSVGLSVYPWYPSGYSSLMKLVVSWPEAKRSWHMSERRKFWLWTSPLMM